MDPLLVEHVRSLLENAGIECHVRNRDLRPLAGAIPFPECWPEVWVEDASQVPAAERVIEGMTAPRAGAERSWQCETCGEVLSDRFTSCWRCAGAPEIRLARRPFREAKPRLGAGHRRALLWIAFVVMAYAALAMLNAESGAW
jgi:hypothetical protein